MITKNENKNQKRSHFETDPKERTGANLLQRKSRADLFQALFKNRRKARNKSEGAAKIY